MIKACHSSPKIPEKKIIETISTFYTSIISGKTQLRKQLGHISPLLRSLVN